MLQNTVNNQNELVQQWSCWSLLAHDIDAAIECLFRHITFVQNLYFLWVKTAVLLERKKILHQTSSQNEKPMFAQTRGATRHVCCRCEVVSVSRVVGQTKEDSEQVC